MVRKILAVIVAYIIFAITAVLLFNISGHNPHQDAPLTFKCLTLAYGVFFSIIAGCVLQLIAKTKNLRLNIILALVMFAFAGISLLTSAGNHWTQLFAMVAFAPSSIVGGYLKLRSTKNKLI
jgi:peptidoglycan/LPS O-acetylase OafA/YrhL